MTRTFIQGFVHTNDLTDDAFYLEDEIYLTSKDNITDAFEYVGYMAFSDGSYMVIYQNTALSTRYYGVEFENEDAFEDWFNARWCMNI